MKNKLVDQYISSANSFARPILIHLREVIHTVCPKVQESIKWGTPFFEYEGILCCMAAFTKHCSFGFWKGSLLKDTHKILRSKRDNGMNHLGKITKIDDLPSEEVLKSYLLQAIVINEKKLCVSRELKAKKDLKVPKILQTALENNGIALSNFEKLSFTHKKEYVEWIEEAKTDPTREKRLQTTLEWLEEGKSRNWKYLSCK